MLTLFYHPIYTYGINPEARFPRERYLLLSERLQTVPGIELRQPRQATRLSSRASPLPLACAARPVVPMRRKPNSQ